MDVGEQDTASLSGLRVLIVEDEPILAMCLSEAIEGEGCVVVGTAHTVVEALALVATALFDVALLDRNLHGQPVGSIAAAIVDRGCAVVFSTGSGASAVPAMFQGWPVLRKPYKDEDVFAALVAVRAVQPQPSCSL